MKKAYAEINLDAILYNYRHLKCQYNKNIIAVLKDNAYGFGALQVARKLANEEGIIFAVKNMDEAIELRLGNIKNDILVLGVFEKKDISFIKEYRLQVVVTTIEQLNWIKNQSVPFHLKINTGMNRLGLSIDDYNEAIKKIKENQEQYQLVGIMTHFATKDDNHQQYQLFCKCLESMDTSNLIIHCLSSNSLFEENVTNYLRVGLKLYGFSERSSMLKSALELYAPIIYKSEVSKGEKVGYDFVYEVPEDGYLYVLPVGYANGWGRFQKSFVSILPTFLSQAGNISMDYSVYFSKEDIKKDTIVALLNVSVPLEQLAAINGISMYQILVNLKIDRYYL